MQSVRIGAKRRPARFYGLNESSWHMRGLRAIYPLYDALSKSDTLPSTVRDYGPFSAHLTISHNAGEIDPVMGRVMSPDATASYVTKSNFTNAKPIISGFPFFVSIWVRSDDYNNGDNVWAVRDDAASPLSWGVYEAAFSGKIGIWRGSNFTTYTPQDLQLTYQWRHWIQVFRATDDKELYINGVSAASNTDTHDTWTGDCSEIKLFAHPAYDNQWNWDGAACDFRIYNRDIKAAEALEFYKTIWDIYRPQRLFVPVPDIGATPVSQTGVTQAEGLQGISQTGIVQVEGRGPLTQSGATPAEGIQPISQTGITQVESKTTGIMAAGATEVESSGSVSESKPTQVESIGSAISTEASGVIVVESLRLLSKALITCIEGLISVSQATPSECESLKTISVSGSTQVEGRPSLLGRLGDLTIPEERVPRWDLMPIGCTGGIPDTSGWLLINMVTHPVYGGCDPTGTTDCRVKIYTACNAQIRQIAIGSISGGDGQFLAGESWTAPGGKSGTIVSNISGAGTFYYTGTELVDTDVITANSDSATASGSSSYAPKRIYFPAGTYYVDVSAYNKTLWILRDYVEICGDGDTSILSPKMNTDNRPQSLIGNGLGVYEGDNFTDYKTITGGHTAGSKTITVSSAPDTGVWTAGKVVLIRYQTDPVWLDRPVNPKPPLSVVAKIVSVSGTSITIDRPLHFDFNLQTAQIAIEYNHYMHWIGLRDIKFYGHPGGNYSTGGGWLPLFSFRFMSDGWAKNVTFEEGFQSSLRLSHYTTNVTIQSCNFYRSRWSQSQLTGNVYLLFFTHCVTNCLVENCWFDDGGTKHITGSAGVHGCVLAYNYCGDLLQQSGTRRNIYFHGHYASENLVEGNDIDFQDGAIEIDNWWGRNGTRNCIFRNRARDYGDADQGDCAIRTSYNFDWPVSDYASFLGNAAANYWKIPYGVGGIDIHSTNMWLEKNIYMRNFLLIPEATTTPQVAADKDNIQTTTPQTSWGLPSSLYYTAKPSWWPSSKSWPCIGADKDDISNVSSLIRLPADDRRLGGPTEVSASGTTQVETRGPTSASRSTLVEVRSPIGSAASVTLVEGTLPVSQTGATSVEATGAIDVSASGETQVEASGFVISPILPWTGTLIESTAPVVQTGITTVESQSATTESKSTQVESLSPTSQTGATQVEAQGLTAISATASSQVETRSITVSVGSIRVEVIQPFVVTAATEAESSVETTMVGDVLVEGVESLSRIGSSQIELRLRPELAVLKRKIIARVKFPVKKTVQVEF